MLNQVILVGRVLEISELNETSLNVKYLTLTLEVRRNYRNNDGEFEYDKIKCTSWRGLAENIKENVRIGSVIGIKGRIISHLFINDDKEYNNLEVIAEYVSFLNL